MSLPPWLVMWGLAFSIFAGCKWLTWRARSIREAPAWRHAAYLFAWPGLDADAFLRATPLAQEDRPRPREWAAAAAKLLVGLSLFFGATRWIPQSQPLLIGWLGMVGLILILHFGSFHLLSCFWRAQGVNARPLMQAPLSSLSVSEFWGKRWNTAFRDFTHRFLFRPLAARLGPRGAIAAGFLFSGVVHDAVISVPAGGGYGGPTLFFAVQGGALLFERSRAGRAMGLDQPARGWVFTMAVLAAPLYGLFHPPFVERIIVPFMRVLGAGVGHA